MKTYKICIEKWTRVTQAGTGYKFHNYELYEIFVTGFKAAKEKAKQIKEALKLANLFSCITIRDPSSYGIAIRGGTL